MLDFPALIKRSLDELKRNYTLGLPTFIAVLVVTFLSLFILKNPEDTEQILVMSVISMIISFIAHGITLVMAAESLEQGTPSLLSGVGKSLRYLPSFAASALMVGSIIIGGSLMLFVPGIIAAYLLTFVFPAIVIEGLGPVGAIKRSYKMAIANARETLMLFSFLFSTGMIFVLVNLGLTYIPIVGQFIELVLSGFFGAMVALILIGAFKALSAIPAEGKAIIKKADGRPVRRACA